MPSTPRLYWLGAGSLPLPGFLKASGVTPAYCAITSQSGQTYFTPARYPASNLLMSGMSMPPTNPTFFDLPTSAAIAPTRNDPSSSRNFNAATFGGGGITLPAESVDSA